MSTCYQIRGHSEKDLWTLDKLKGYVDKNEAGFSVQRSSDDTGWTACQPGQLPGQSGRNFVHLYMDHENRIVEFERFGLNDPAWFAAFWRLMHFKVVSEHDDDYDFGVDEDEDPNEPELTADLQIEMFMHCRKCLEDQPGGISPRDYARLEFGYTKQGIQVWCVRHEHNVVHIDFEGVQHRAV